MSHTTNTSAPPVLLLVDAPTVAEPARAPGFRAADPHAPQVQVTDLGVSRGDGVFETIGVVAGRPLQLEPHLTRLTHSAAVLDLPAPRADVWRAAVLAAIGAAGGGDLSVKTVLTRGVEGTDRCTGWVLATAAPDMTRARQHGLRVVTLDRGYSSDVAVTSPWLLQGAKYTSYAVNMAALREARSRGADDVIFTSTDGYVLEGPTASVVLRAAETLITPATDQGILAGTTQSEVFTFAASRGMRTEARPVPVAELEHAEQVWLCSSVRLCAPVRSLDGRELTVDRELTEALLAHLAGRGE
ncbi:aminodeoxychorismate lyase [Ruania albidiflava]|uniref:aminodeoxychorismate lyase n=1 Tax=Ruania albidiflava TaxID=366586 RepID=UPI0003B70741|nr:aminodeoxychorismate lyase [Ruania albidiflava]